IIIKITHVVLKLAPLGVFALMASVVATQGLEIIKNLSVYVIGLAAALILVAAVMYNLLFLLTGVNISKFWRSFYPAFAFAFGTASSGASLPLAMENARERYGMKDELVSFAFPFGIAMKKDGAALLQAFSALFVAQMAGISLTGPQMTAIIVSSLLVSFSTAGVPAGGMIMMATVLSAAGLPLEGILILVGVDRLTDTLRSSLNVIGPAANAAILEKWENKKHNA
ncbi:dicarboxylate/amino acid:cation symporter, partial [Planctomycetota bacterium]